MTAPHTHGPTDSAVPPAPGPTAPAQGPGPAGHDPYAVPSPPPRDRPRNLLATLAVVLGACGAAAPGLVLGVLGLRGARRSQGAGRGRAWIGIALSVVWGVVLVANGGSAPWSTTRQDAAVGQTRSSAADDRGRSGDDRTTTDDGTGSTENPGSVGDDGGARDAATVRQPGAWLGRYAPDPEQAAELMALVEDFELDPEHYITTYWEAYYESMWTVFGLDRSELDAAVDDALACDGGDDRACDRVRALVPGA